MSSTTDSPAMETWQPLMSVSLSLALLTVILIFLMLLYIKKERLCCRFRQHGTEHSADDAPHYNGRSPLTGITYNEHGATGTQAAAGSQLPGMLFSVGKPHDYHLSEAQLKLPSYESVRKKDLRRQMHAMIAQRFGLSGGHDEPPPTYEETASRQSLDISPVRQHSLDALTQDRIPHFGEDTQRCHEPTTGSQASVSSYCPAQNPRFLPV